MIFPCEKCRANCVVPDDKLLQKGYLKIRCTNCGHKFYVRTLDFDVSKHPKLKNAQIPKPSVLHWYYEENEEAKGPVSLEELQALFDDGIVQADTFVWAEGMEDWVELSELPELFEYLKFHEGESKKPSLLEIEEEEARKLAEALMKEEEELRKKELEQQKKKRKRKPKQQKAAQPKEQPKPEPEEPERPAEEPQQEPVQEPVRDEVASEPASAKPEEKKEEVVVPASDEEGPELAKEPEPETEIKFEAQDEQTFMVGKGDPLLQKLDAEILPVGDEVDISSLDMDDIYTPKGTAFEIESVKEEELKLPEDAKHKKKQKRPKDELEVPVPDEDEILAEDKKKIDESSATKAEKEDSKPAAEPDDEDHKKAASKKKSKRVKKKKKKKGNLETAVSETAPQEEPAKDESSQQEAVKKEPQKGADIIAFPSESAEESAVAAQEEEPSKEPAKEQDAESAEGQAEESVDSWMQPDEDIEWKVSRKKPSAKGRGAAAAEAARKIEEPETEREPVEQPEEEPTSKEHKEVAEEVKQEELVAKPQDEAAVEESQPAVADEELVQELEAAKERLEEESAEEEDSAPIIVPGVVDEEESQPAEESKPAVEEDAAPESLAAIADELDDFLDDTFAEHIEEDKILPKQTPQATTEEDDDFIADDEADEVAESLKIIQQEIPGLSVAKVDVADTVPHEDSVSEGHEALSEIASEAKEVINEDVIEAHVVKAEQEKFLAESEVVEEVAKEAEEKRAAAEPLPKEKVKIEIIIGVAAVLLIAIVVGLVVGIRSSSNSADVDLQYDEAVAKGKLSPAEALKRKLLAKKKKKVATRKKSAASKGSAANGKKEHSGSIFDLGEEYDSGLSNALPSLGNSLPSTAGNLNVGSTPRGPIGTSSNEMKRPMRESLSPAIIESTIAAQNGRFKYCYDTFLRTNEPIDGQVFLDFEIAPSGRVTKLRLISREFKGTTMIDCLRRVARKMRFPRFSGPSIPVRYPLSFEKEE